MAGQGGRTKSKKAQNAAYKAEGRKQSNKKRTAARQELKELNKAEKLFARGR